MAYNTHVSKIYGNRKHILNIKLMRTSYLIQAQNYQNDIKHTFPDLIRLVGRESQETVSVTLLLTVDTEVTGPEFPFCFAGGLCFVGEVLAAVGELLKSFGGDLLSVADSFLLSFGICFLTTAEPFGLGEVPLFLRVSLLISCFVETNLALLGDILFGRS